MVLAWGAGEAARGICYTCAYACLWPGMALVPHSKMYRAFGSITGGVHSPAGCTSLSVRPLAGPWQLWLDGRYVTCSLV